VTRQGFGRRRPPSALRRNSEGLFRLFLAEGREPGPFYERLAHDAVRGIPFALQGATVVDLGCGPGYYTRALRSSGARVLPIDLNPTEFGLAGGPPGDEMVASGMALPLATGSVDGVFSSNMIEHTPDPGQVVSEAERVLRIGGWLWLSWTNWYSPWGGHDMSPFHYLGPRLGMRVRNAVGLPEPKNYPLRSLFPLHIGATLRMIGRRPGLRVLAVEPRYYPSHRWLVRVPGLREIATWNCVVLAQRVEEGRTARRRD